MALQPMYPGKINSPQTELASAIDNQQTTISLLDAGVLPDPPNICTIGTGEDAETVLYEGIDGNDLTGVTRGFQGAARAWVQGTKVARNFTAYDYDALRQNIEEAQTTANTHASRHAAGGPDEITPEMIGAETPAGAQAKVDAHAAATTGVHGATSAATPNTIIQRDPSGRAKVAAPVESDDIARKAEVDGKVSKSGDTMTGPLDVRVGDIPAVIVRRENRGDWIALAAPGGNPYSSKIVIKSESIGQDPTEYEMVRFNSSLGNVGKQISFLTSNVERVRVEDSITSILNGLRVTGQIYRGTGSPEGSVSAPVGSIYHRTDGGAGTTLYVKESGTGNTGWVAK